MIVVWGVSLALLVQMLCYLPFLFVIRLLHPRNRLPPETKKEVFMSALNSGIRHVIKSPLICHSLLITALYSFLIRGTLELLPAIADGLFSKGASGLGLLTSSAGLGALIAGITKAFMPGQISGKLSKYVLVSTLLGIILLPLLGLSNSWTFTLICISFLGFSGTLAGISIQTAIQIDLSDDLRGRVMSLWTMIGMASLAIGAISLGSLADYIGFTLAFSVCSTLGILVLASFFLKLR